MHACMHACIHAWIKTHDSESRGQEEAGRTQRTSRLTIVSREAKKKQAVRNKRVSYLHVAPL